MNILLVEDDEGIRDSLAQVLDFDMYVLTAIHGLDALNYLEVNPPPSVILLDLAMPVMNGWEFRKRQLDNPKLAKIPVIVISAFHWSQIQRDELQAAAYFEKPPNLDLLIDTIKRVVMSRPPPDPTLVARTGKRNTK